MLVEIVVHVETKLREHRRRTDINNKEELNYY